MHQLRKVIASHQQALRDHRFLELVRTTTSLEAISSLARAVAWWPMVFQDVLRLNVERVRGTGYERFVEYHQQEDAGHDRWYLDDLRVLNLDEPALDELFGEAYRPIREASYSLMAEVLRPQTGKQRVALLLALEPTGHLFFEHIADAVERVGPDLPLTYFARSHLGVEKGHDLFAASTEADLDRIVLTDDERADSERVVARIYATFDGVYSYLADNMDVSSRGTSHVSELGGDRTPSKALRAHGS